MNKGDAIRPDEFLLRRVFRLDRRFIDLKTGRPTSRAFAPRPKDNGSLSVDLKIMTTPIKAIIDIERFRLFEFMAHSAYSLGLECKYDPLDDNVAHTLITGFDPEDESVPGILARISKEVLLR